MGVRAGVTGLSVPILEPRIVRHLDRGQAATVAWVRLSKIEYYHSDNLSTIRLSDVKHAVNKKRRFGRVV